MKPLIILESPGKVKNVKHYTDGKCDVTATAGHIKDLPKDAIGINEDAAGKIDFKSIKYVPLPGKTETIKRIKAQAAGRDVLLATDPDREGESISYDVYGEIKRSAASVKRIEIHAITPRGVAQALGAPRQIDQKIVDAQRTRRFIDRLAGYKLTKWAASALGTSQWIEASVGRTQSAALKLVYDRDEEIKKFVPLPFWRVKLTDRRGNVFFSRKFNTSEEASELTSKLKRGAYVAKIERRKLMEAPPAPLTASTLQQNASRRFGYMPEETMSIAQELFNNSRITYMRTDSVHMAPETVEQIRRYLETAFTDALPEKAREHKDKGAAVQGAHEAIHPTDMTSSGEPSKLEDLTPKEFNIYKLIWDYAMASQAKDAEWDCIKVTALPAGGTERHELVSGGRALAAPGWRVILGKDAEKSAERAAAEREESPALSFYREKSPVEGDAVACREETKPPAHYTINTLLKALEKNGVGRPATWATIIKTILNRNYVAEEKGTVRHTPKGEAMVFWLMEVCPQLASVRFTALMEDSLAEIEQGKARKEDVVNDFNAVLNRSIEKAKSIPAGKYHFAGVDYSNRNTYSTAKSPSVRAGASKTSYSAQSGARSAKSAKKAQGRARTSSGSKPAKTAASAGRYKFSGIER